MKSAQHLVHTIKQVRRQCLELADVDELDERDKRRQHGRSYGFVIEYNAYETSLEVSMLASGVLAKPSEPIAKVTISRVSLQY